MRRTGSGGMGGEQRAGSGGMDTVGGVGDKSDQGRLKWEEAGRSGRIRARWKVDVDEEREALGERRIETLGETPWQEIVGRLYRSESKWLS